MLIKKKSMLSGIDHEMELPITQEQVDSWHAGKLIQDAFPNLTPNQREFLISGSTQEEWDLYMAEDEDEDDSIDEV